MLQCWLAGRRRRSAQSQAQAWPQRSVRFILTLGAGSGTDIGGRLLADRLSKKWGQPVVIENKPGGDGIVAITAFLGAKDDHVLLLSPTSAFIAHPWVHDNLSYKPADLVPIARVSNTVIGITVPASLPANSMKELVALAKAKPGELNWAGITGALDFNFAGWAKSQDLDMKKVPYRNPVEAANDLGENRVQVYEIRCRDRAAANHVRQDQAAGRGQFGACADLSRRSDRGGGGLSQDDHRRPGRPVRDAGNAEALREKIAADVKEVMDADPIIKDRLMATAQLPNPGTPEEFAKAIEEQREKLAQNRARPRRQGEAVR